MLLIAGVMAAEPLHKSAPPRNTAEVRTLLASQVDFPGIDDPKATLGHALTLLRERYGLIIFVNEGAFREMNVRDVLKTQIEIPRFDKVPLYYVLRDVVTRVPVPGHAFDPFNRRLDFDPLTGLPAYVFDEIPERADFLIRRNGIMITTAVAICAMREQPEPAPPLTQPRHRSQQEVRAALAREVDFPGLNDPKLTLLEALVSLGERYGLAISVNEAAFQDENVRDVLRSPVAETEIPPIKEIQLDRLVRGILKRVVVPSGAVYQVRSFGIEVTAERYLRDRKQQPEPFAPPTSRQCRRARELRETLVRPSQFDGFDDPKMTLQESLAVMVSRYGLEFQVNVPAFYYENFKEVEKTPIAEEKPIPKADRILPGKILEMVLARVPVPTGAVFVIRPQGYIEITTRRAVAAELLGVDLDSVPL
jgi:hypothetical protein